MKKILYVYGGPDFHPSEAAGRLLQQMLAADGRFALETTADLDAFSRLPEGDYAAVVIYTTGFDDQLTGERERGLLQFVLNGGGVVGVHSALASFRQSRPYVEMMGGEFVRHPEWYTFTVSLVDREHYITTRVPDFTIGDELYMLKSYDPAKVHLLMQTPWQGQQMPLGHTKEYGRGRVVYLGNGHDMRAWTHPTFQKLLIRAIAWATGANKPEARVRVGLLGYGPAFNMGKGHADWMGAIEGMEVVAMCDASPARVEAAKQELPGLQGYFTDVSEMLKMPGLDLVTIILPHNLHAEYAVRCLEAGMHVITEKPFCITVAEANAMIDAARRNGRMLSVFHNRRWDDDYLAIKDIIARGLIGEIYRIEAFAGSHGHPGFWWRSEKAISGGVMYDWGAHILDWILGLVPSPIKQITGDLQKRVWHSVTNEDHGEAWIRFENGVIADLVMSNIAASKRPKWVIYGTRGSLEYDWDWGQEIRLHSNVSGVMQESKIQFPKRANAWAEYYRNIADHLLYGEELIVKPEQARRVIGVMEAVAKSTELGTSVPPCEGCE